MTIYVHRYVQCNPHNCGDVEAINRLIRSHVERDVYSMNGEHYPNYLYFRIEGTEEQCSNALKKIRRLSRAKMKFTVYLAGRDQWQR